MQRKPEGWNVVLAGYWNRMIFTPEWVGPLLFDGAAQIETVVALLPVLPITYRDSQMAVEISTARIVCRARDLESEAALRRSGEVAGTILRELPQTPLQGLGINFGFCEPVPDGGLLDLFSFGDNARLAEAEWEAGERKIVRRLIRDDETLNLTLSLDNGRLDIDYNFHTDPGDNDAAVAAVSPDRIIQLRDMAIDMSGQLYGLQLEEEDGEI